VNNGTAASPPRINGAAEEYRNLSNQTSTFGTRAAGSDALAEFGTV